MKGLILAGGKGTRLYPCSYSVSKQLLPVYDKPAIYYPLSTLMFMDIREIAIISTPRDLPMIKDLLGDGHQLGLKLSYLEQTEPRGIADAFLVAKNFIGDASVTLILGDNLFFGYELPKRLRRETEEVKGATIFALQVRKPEEFGVVELGKNDEPLALWEKPSEPKSNWAVTGLYIYDNQVVKLAEQLELSPRGELEVTDLNRAYLERKQLKVVSLGRGTAWLDTGTPENLLKSAQFVQTIEERQGLKISCLEEVALRRGFITEPQFKDLTDQLPDSPYKEYLQKLIP